MARLKFRLVGLVWVSLLGLVTVSFAASSGDTITPVVPEEEIISIETFYPSPWGRYGQMEIEESLAIGNVDGDSNGVIDRNDMAGYKDAFDQWQLYPGSLTVAGRVGIGTTNPVSRLQIKSADNQIVTLEGGDLDKSTLYLGTDGDGSYLEAQGTTHPRQALRLQACYNIDLRKSNGNNFIPMAVPKP